MNDYLKSQMAERLLFRGLIFFILKDIAMQQPDPEAYIASTFEKLRETILARALTPEERAQGLTLSPDDISVRQETAQMAKTMQGDLSDMVRALAGK